MKKVSLTCLFVLCSYFVFAQTDTSFVNENGSTVDKNIAAYYRTITQSNNKKYVFSDYYFNHQIAKQIEYTSPLGTIKNGMAHEYDSLGNLTVEGFYESGFDQNEWKYFYTNHKVREKRIYQSHSHAYQYFKYDSITEKLNETGFIDENGKYYQGRTIYFDTLSSVFLQQNYVNGRKEGEQIEYYTDGKIKRIENYKNGFFDKGKLFDENGKQQKFYPAFEYPKSKTPLHYYLKKSAPCVDSVLKTKDLDVSFWVEKNGTVKNIFVDTNDINCIEEIKKAIQKMKWSPAKKENTPIDFKMKITLTHYKMYY